MKHLFIKFFIIAVGFMAFNSVSAFAQQVNKDWGGVAVKGYDVVSYFKEQKPVKGSKEFVSEYNGAKWYFSSKDNKEEFSKEPLKYVPQYGGFCAFGVSQNHTADIDPNAWTVVNGKLYLNYNQAVSKKWNQERELLIQKADQNWPNLNK